MVSDIGKRARALQLESIHNWHSHVSDNQIGDQNKQLNPLESKMTKFLAIITFVIATDDRDYQVDGIKCLYHELLLRLLRTTDVGKVGTCGES